jgi:tubulin polyglutamylase TTLL7
VVDDMGEPELLDLLSQYEDEGGRATPPWHSGFSRRPSTTSFQSLALEDSNPMGDMFRVMAARLHEEEQTQRTMVALKEMTPFYPGKSQAEVHSVLEQIHENFSTHATNMGAFWLVTLNNSQRKQLLAPVREAVRCLLHSHWRRMELRSLRLHHITSHLMTFLLGHRGGGLWSSICPVDRKTSWESKFRESQETISVAEMECCRRIVELSQSLLYCAYHYHCLTSSSKRKHATPSSRPTDKCISLPHLRRKPSLTTPPMPRPHTHHLPSFLKTSSSHSRPIRPT